MLLTTTACGTPPAPPPLDPANEPLAAAAWLAGRWIGAGFGGECEETWAPAAGGQMVGHFRLVAGGKPRFYEIMLLDRVEAGLRLRVKHFHPDFRGWEEKDGWHSFEPGVVVDGALQFPGLVLRPMGSDRAEFVVTIANGGKTTDERLQLRREPR
ncbi:MAG: hypothetical protein JNK15_09320 [Planctomycetes bacterium]|nr:hypothetical protein [Planctomycetota bacterium]